MLFNRIFAEVWLAELRASLSHNELSELSEWLQTVESMRRNPTRTAYGAANEAAHAAGLLEREWYDRLNDRVQERARLRLRIEAINLTMRDFSREFPLAEHRSLRHLVDVAKEFQC